MIKKYLVISKEITNALNNNLPVVALESTIICHGMPYPQNYQTALQCEKIIRENGAIPATIAIIKGKLRVGLSEDELKYLSENGDTIAKTSTRDIPYVIANNLDGATTVSATSLIASLANIKVFCTGGIGGVHRGASSSFDVSCDLEQLATTNIAVVSAGAKAILDLGATLEYLETKGVDVIGYQTDFFPAFYSSSSNYRVNHRCDDAQRIAKIIKTKWDLNINGGFLIANPIPKDYEIPHQEIDIKIEEALVEMEKLNITGNKTTPFLLSKIKELTSGKSLEANIKLVYNNCILASKIAYHLTLIK